MSLQIDRGLFKLDFTDHHAILGIPVNADEKEVRKRYLKIARRLHPDSCKAESEAEKKRASELLSKLVNPAYEQLSRSNRDYLVSLSLMGKRLASERGKFSVGSQAAKQLAQAGANIDNAYKSALNNLVSKQYESIDQALDKIGELSELNLVYLMVKEGKGLTPSVGDREVSTIENREEAREEAPHPSPPPKDEAYMRRAKGYLEKNNFAAAVLELREALKLQPNNSASHGLLGYAFLKQNQVAMAKVHINKALQLNPQEDIALKCKQHLEKLAQKTGGGTASSPPPKPAQAQSKPPQGKPPQGKPSDKSGGGGLFGGLFGGKKK